MIKLYHGSTVDIEHIDRDLRLVLAFRLVNPEDAEIIAYVHVPIV